MRQAESYISENIQKSRDNSNGTYRLELQSKTSSTFEVYMFLQNFVSISSYRALTESSSGFESPNKFRLSCFVFGRATGLLLRPFSEWLNIFRFIEGTGFSTISRFLERIPIEHVEPSFSPESELLFDYICSIRTRSRNRDIVEKRCS